MMSGPRVGEYFVRTGGQVYGGMEAAGIFAEFWSCVDSLESVLELRRRPRQSIVLELRTSRFAATT